MGLEQLIIGWFYYGIVYMGLSLVATVLINRVANHYVTAPLIINAVAIVLLMGLWSMGQLSADLFWFNLFFCYMPTVAASAVLNLVLYFVRGRRPLREL